MLTRSIRRLTAAVALVAAPLTFSLVAAVGDAAAGTDAAHAPACWVKNTSTSATGADLQAAISAAEAGDVLVLRGVCAGNFSISRDITLVGPAELNGTSCIDGHCSGGIVLWVDRAAVTLKYLTITGGASTYDGGGIQNFGNLTLVSTAVRGNWAEDNAGGIYNEGRLVLNGSSTVSDNWTYYVGNGGGILNRGTLIMNRTSTVTRNSTTNGGGIYNQGTVVMNRASSVTGNTAEVGGGILNNGGHVWFSKRWHGTLCGNTPDDWPGC